MNSICKMSFKYFTYIHIQIYNKTVYGIYGLRHPWTSLKIYRHQIHLHRSINPGTIHLKPTKENSKMKKGNQLNLETLGSQPIIL
jgi:hypothetical protein